MLVTGIANPIYLKDELTKHNPHIDCLSFRDHYQFTEADIKSISTRLQSLAGDKKIIITTEKDSMRLLGMSIPDELKRLIYTIPVEVEILQDKQTVFNQKILDYVRKNKRNSSLSTRENDY